MDTSMIILGTVFISFFILEHFFPLRIRRAVLKKRLIHNFSLTLVALPVTRLITLPLVYYVVSFVSREGWGLLNMINLNRTIHGLLGLIFLDYSIYWWHVCNHEVKFFWRFHEVHHTDKDMDASTALRFHVGELALSAIIRCLLALLIGFSLKTLITFDLLVTSLTIFHHSNLKLPERLDKILSLLIVTPLYHQSHHSFYLSETDSNYSTIFTVWDKIHKSFSYLLNPKEVTIGVPAFEQVDLSLLELIKLPIEKLKAWPEELKKRL